MNNRHLVIEWDLPHVSLLLARREGASWEILQWHRCVLPEHVAESKALSRDAASWLLSECPSWLRELETSSEATSLSVILPRDRVTLRKLELPPIPTEELPGVVPLQMASQLSARMEDLAIDFLPPTSSGSAENQIVLAASLPIDQLRTLQTLAVQLHCELTFVGLSSLTLLEAVPHFTTGTASAQRSLLCIYSEERLEALYCNAGQLIAAGYRRRNRELPFQTKEAVAEIRRLLATETETATLPIQFLSLTDSKNGGVISEAEKALGMPVQLLEIDTTNSTVRLNDNFDLKMPELLSEGGLRSIGALLAEKPSQVFQLNLQAPRQMQELKDHRKAWIYGGAAALVGGLIIAYLAWWGQLAGLDDKIERLNTEIAAVDKFMKDQGKVVEQAKKLTVYQDRSLDFDEHFQKILSILPARDQLLFTEWQSLPLSGESHSRIIASGLARSRQSIESFAEKLAQDGWIVRSPTIRANPERQPFGYEFDLDFEIPAPASAVKSSKRLRVSQSDDSGRNWGRS